MYKLPSASVLVVDHILSCEVITYIQWEHCLKSSIWHQFFTLPIFSTSHLCFLKPKSGLVCDKMFYCGIIFISPFFMIYSKGTTLLLLLEFLLSPCVISCLTVCEVVFVSIFMLRVSYCRECNKILVFKFFNFFLHS